MSADSFLAAGWPYCSFIDLNRRTSGTCAFARNTMKLAHKIAAVMGGGHTAAGLSNGAAVALSFAREGAKVYVVDRDLAAAQLTLDLIHQQCPGNASVALSADVTDEQQVAAVFAQIERDDARLDVLHNNVGVEFMGGILETSIAQWRRAFSLNVESAVLAMQQAIPLMQRSGGGAIINVSSAASMKYSGVKYVSYNTTKAALNQLTRTTAVQYAPQKIRVNTILPGLMKTPMVAHSAGLAQAYGEGDVEAMWAARDAQVPMGHMGEAWDVAYAALFLASDEARYVTGVCIPVDGGKACTGK